uniref:Restriction endonuclease subunit S n=1 Tax=Paenibacillus polymyxa TaxID=1406 RepID=A0AAE9I7L1_PAEPO
MAVWSEVKRIDVLEYNRLDSEFYRMDYITAINKVRLLGSKKIKQTGIHVVSGPFGSTLKSHSYLNEGIPFIRILDLKTFFISNEQLIYISEESNRRIRGSQLKAGDLVLSKVGNSIGLVSILDDDYPIANISENNIGIKFSEHHSDRFKKFILTYLNSVYGQNEILRRRSGNAQPKLNVSDIYDIEIPYVSDTNLTIISELVDNAGEKLKLSKSLYAQAQSILEKELGLDQLVLKKTKSYEVSFSEVVGSHRIDALCFKPDYIDYEKYLRKRGNFDYLRDVLSSSIKGQQAKPVVDGNLEYVSIKDIQGLEIYSKEKCRLTSKLRVAQKDDLLLAITGATIGKIGAVSRSTKLAFSGDLLSLKTNAKIDPYYLLAVMSNSIGQSQCHRWITGTTNGHLSPSDVNKIVIPRVSAETEKNISINAIIYSQGIRNGTNSRTSKRAS